MKPLCVTMETEVWPGYGCAPLSKKESDLDIERKLNAFLAGVEKRALRMAELATGNRDDAMELVQDAMMGLARKYASRPEEEWPPLFHRILQNGIRDWHRRRLRRYEWRRLLPQRLPFVALAGQPDDAPGSDARGPFEQVAQSRFAAALLAALAELPVRQQQVFLLRVWEGLDVADTARAMACSQGSVKTHYFRAMHRLREALEEYRP